jgi:hypothetical protein
MYLYMHVRVHVYVQVHVHFNVHLDVYEHKQVPFMFAVMCKWGLLDRSTALTA